MAQQFHPTLEPNKCLCPLPKASASLSSPKHNRLLTLPHTLVSLGDPPERQQRRPPFFSDWRWPPFSSEQWRESCNDWLDQIAAHIPVPLESPFSRQPLPWQRVTRPFSGTGVEPLRRQPVDPIKSQIVSAAARHIWVVFVSFFWHFPPVLGDGTGRFECSKRRATKVWI